MPQRGTKPKDDDQKRHRNRPTHAWTEVPDLPFDGPVPELPKRRGGWSERAKRKWAAWSSMPHCRLWGDAEWEFAIDSLELAAKFYAGDRPAATELRNREKQLGTTADYRRDLRIRYVDPDALDRQDEAEREEASVTNISDYRDLYADD